MRSRVLITGGLGNLGSWITREFLEQGHDVTVTTSSNRKLEGLDFKVLAIDLSDPENVANTLADKGFDVIVHAGSLNDSFVDGYSWRSYRVNVEGTSSLINVLNRAGVRHFIYFSTFHVYGRHSGCVSPETMPNPQNDYATSHYAAECIVRQHHQVQGLPMTILRLTNGYGCPISVHSAKWHLLLNDLARMAVNDRKLVIKSGADMRRDFLWMGDIARATRELVERNLSIGLTLDASYGKSLSLLEAATEVQLAFEEFTGDKIPLETGAATRAECEDRLVVDSTQLWSLLGWSPSMRIREEAISTFKLLAAK